MLNVSEDIQFQIECLSTELVEMLMQKYGWDMKKALDELYFQRPISVCATLIVVYTTKVRCMCSRI